MTSAIPLPPNEDGYEYTFIGDLKQGDVVRTHGVVEKIEPGSITTTVYFKNEGVTKCRTWHPFHSIEVKKESK